MAGDWIKMRVDLLDDPSVIQIAQLTKLDRDAILGKLYRLWCWADRHAKDGTVSVMGDWVDEMLGHFGFADAMRQAGWLEFTSTKMVFPKFDRHNGESAKKRIIEAEKKRKQRDGTLSPKCPPKKGTLSPKNGDQRREEKRRDIQESKDSCTAATAATPPNGKPQSRPRSEKQTARDALWEAVKSVWGLPDATPAQQSRMGKLVTEFASQGAVPDEIAIRRRRIAETWGAGKDTPESTAKHWGEFAAEPDRPADGRYRGGSVTTFDRPADFDMAAQSPGPDANQSPW